MSTDAGPSVGEAGERRSVPAQNVPGEPPEDDSIQALFDQLPPSTRRELVASVHAVYQRIGPAPSPLLRPANEKHLDRFLEIVQRGEDQAHELRKRNGILNLVYFWSAIITAAAAIVFLISRDRAMLDTLLQILLSLAAGFGAGYAYKTHRE